MVTRRLLTDLCASATKPTLFIVNLFEIQNTVITIEKEQILTFKTLKVENIGIFVK